MQHVLHVYRCLHLHDCMEQVNSEYMFVDTWKHVQDKLSCTVNCLCHLWIYGMLTIERKLDSFCLLQKLPKKFTFFFRLITCCVSKPLSIKLYLFKSGFCEFCTASTANRICYFPFIKDNQILVLLLKCNIWSHCDVMSTLQMLLV